MELLFIAAIGLMIYLVVKGTRPSQPRAIGPSPQQAEVVQRRWNAVRRVAEEDVTQLGQQIAATEVPADLEAEGREEFQDALDAYERAKEALATAESPDDLQWVSRSLDDGRFALARLDARREGKPLPTRTAPCFFDQRHGLSIGEALWAPAGGAPRDVPVCAACQAMIADGQDPQARLVETPNGMQPYYSAGPEYAPWARGWYAGSGLHVLNSVMLGTLLLNSLYLPVGMDTLAADSGFDPGADLGGDYGGDPSGDYGGDLGGGDMGGGFDFGGF